MKIINSVKKRFLTLTALALLSFISVQTFAQDKGLDVNINVKKEDEWYKQPWVWVIGAAVFVLLLVAILRGGKKY